MPVKLERDSLQKLQDMMYNVASALSSDAAQRCRNKNLPELGPQEIVDAIKDSFPEDIMKHATANGSSYVTRLENGTLEYKPKKPKVEGKPAAKRKRGKKSSGRSGTSKRAKPRSKRKAPAKDPPKPSSIFTKAVKKMLSDLTDETPHKITARPNAQEMLNDILYNTGDFLANKIAENSLNKNLAELDSEHVIDVVRDIFPKDLMQHALSVGATRLAQFNSGIVHDQPEAMDKKVRGKKMDVAALRPADFKKGVLRLNKQFNGQNVSLTNDASEKLNNFLFDACKTLVDNVNADSGSDITAESIRNTTEQLFPADLAQCALSHGCSTVNKFTLSNTPDGNM